ncbi:PAS domain-containing methyl-accepting chemotaxis protein [Methylobacterium sp. NEAU K]|uniref:methyl-accepting chemotaxis protein n=1 Tax=Methylobacterium sp. NEAU K TaxID=3064946 RepID=UPI0027349B23|nr:PAS domain-containing methyl-accepting chemotaxis protein [Methylobacterium sp. NEAU K]MDP4003361.1 PAS domain-containing methyl-accepting chemotaxis protein [Methylobacterium sp. NEAU K]
MLNLQSRTSRATLAALNRSQAVIEFSPDGTVLTANDNFLTTMGYSLAEVRGRHHSFFVPPTERNDAAYQALWDDLRRGTFRSAEFLRVAKDGREVWIRGSYNPVLGRGGRVEKIVKFATDITEQKLRSLDAEQRIAAFGLSQAVIVFAADGTIEDANPNFLDALGYRLDEIRGRHHSLFVDPAERGSADYHMFWQALMRGEFQSAEYRRIGNGGREVWIQATYNPILDTRGHVFRVVKLATDITSRVREQQRRAEAGCVITGELNRIGDAVSGVTNQSSDAASTVERVSRDIQTVASGAEDLAASVTEISQQVIQASEMSRKAVVQSQQTGAIVIGLSEQAEQIGEVVSLIQTIAEQTNLLALNATIEAARAGQAGKGFAVVAAEVKALAGQTAKATDEIRARIGATRDATGKAVDAISTIQATIEKLNHVSAAIAAAVEEQATVTREISGSMQTASKGTTHIASSIGAIADTMFQVDQITQRVRKISGEIA